MTRKPLRLLALALAAASAAVVTPTAAQAAAPYCGITWGSLARTADAPDSESLTGVLAGRHSCFDRLVIDVGGQDATFGSFDVRYVRQVVQDGSGGAVPVRGAADLQVIVRAPVHDAQGRPTFTPANRREVVDVTGYQTFRQVAWAGSFEGRTTLALGVRARLPFRGFTLDGVPNSGDTPRLVIDVAHRW